MKSEVPSQTSPPPVALRAPATAHVAPSVFNFRAGARFWVCLALLLCAAVGLKAAAWKLGVVLRKEAWPLKQPLALFDARKLGPDYELDPRTFKLEPLSEDMIETLGTHEYLQVYLADLRKPLDHPARVALLFVTYYTGQPDMVPHEPDQCWAAAGYDRAGAETVTVPVPGAGVPGGQLPVRLVQFRAAQRDPFAGVGGDVATILYFFHANGHYALSRNDVRETMSNPFQRTAYYMKVEITFTSASGARAAPADALPAVGPLLARVLPVLMDDHLDLPHFASATAGRN